ncbi:hypothetical protein [Amazonocrinis nigriterrae]|uniref:hypothetical protein n=1 Tax=Amazonocrinis nigriterrae TaxID=2840443 RepID=UPI001BE4B50B|nr:hypothetical protein [Amazonocrinis nigriterrae]
MYITLSAAFSVVKTARRFDGFIVTYIYKADFCLNVTVTKLSYLENYQLILFQIESNRGRVSLNCL